MTHYCLDFCSLLNLYCGWGGIQEFRRFGQSWSISQVAFNEFKYVRAIQANGSLLTQQVNHSIVLSQYPLSVIPVTRKAELATMMGLSMHIDDGEAASLSLAKHRGLIFVTDDKPAVKKAFQLSVPTVSSLELLRTWEALSPQHAAQIPMIIGRIAVLASFHPSKSDPNFGWWRQHRAI
ncbi:hypothetical protein [Xanthomonas campestris]|uniref:hypothetical protein n=1 Tax=Xanthomonas campestris TaxID=339 RepID=UPI002377F914|nr:hypothetical protein [Xanthomonas campestris]WDJ75226.1 type II toxin-antitoxin system VapC family toxin [Xanthomonas campestris pv. campestris]